MRVLILYAHPLDDSFNADLHARVCRILRSRGHDVDDCDLYAEGFDPLLGADDLRIYRDVTANRRRVEAYANRLLSAQGLVLVFPVWSEGLPAILKGFLDRVFIPGVAFNRMPGGKTRPGLPNLAKLGAVCTYGASRFTTILLGDPTRRVVKRLVRSMAARHVRCDYLAFYGIDSSSQSQRAAFGKVVERTLAKW